MGLLEFADVEIHEAAQSAKSGDVHVRQGDAVVLTNQPFGSFAKTMLERRHYPDMRQYPGGPPKHPYDSTAHCLPLNMGVTCHEITQPLKINLGGHPFEDDKQRPESVIPAFAGIQTGGSVGNSQNHLELALVRSRKHEGSQGSSRPIPEDAPALADETRIERRRPCRQPAAVPGFPGLQSVGHGTDRERRSPRRDMGHSGIEPSRVGVTVRRERSSANRSRCGKGRIRVFNCCAPPRIGLYASYVPCIEEGWTRFLFDEYGFKYVSLADRDIREGGLSSRFDCIIIPHQEIRQIHRGLNRTHHSPHFSGGLGDVGVDKSQGLRGTWRNDHRMGQLSQLPGSISGASRSQSAGQAVSLPVLRPRKPSQHRSGHQTPARLGNAGDGCRAVHEWHQRTSWTRERPSRPTQSKTRSSTDG